MPEELYGDHAYYFPQEGAVVKIPYAVGLSQQTEGPADTVTSAQARVYRHHSESADNLLTTHDLRLIGQHELELDISRYVPAEDSPLVVEFVFEKVYRAAGPKRGSIETQSAHVILALAEPAVGELVAEPEVLRAGEAAEIRVSKWAALTYDEPGTARLEVDHDEPALAQRFPPDYPERVVWTRQLVPAGSSQDVGTGTDRRHTWAAEDDGCTVVYTATIGAQPAAPEARVHGAATCFELLFRDPADPALLLPFPAGLPVAICYDDGSEQAATVREGGILAAELDRTQPGFTLRLADTPGSHVGLDPERACTLLVDAAEVSDCWRAGWRTFRLPRMTLAEAEVAVSVPEGAAPFDPVSARFVDLDDLDRTYGTADAPILIVLEPRWQYLRFGYHDRWLERWLSVPVAHDHEALPLVPEGFSDEDSAPHAAAYWPVTTAGEERAVLALPWWTTGATPCRLRFGWPKQGPFVRSADDGSRRLVHLSPEARDTPSADRLRHYDLPLRWSSDGALARLGERCAPFAELASQPTHPERPLTFDLDDLVLTDEDLRPLAWDRAPDVSLFHHRFARESERDPLGPDGLYRPDPRPGRSRFSDVDASVNYFHDRPSWTRLVLADGAAFDVFDARVPEGVGGQVGARAAVRLLDPAAPAGEARDAESGDLRRDGRSCSGRALSSPPVVTRPFAIAQRELTHEQPDPSSPSGVRRLGRYDVILLRCCGREGAGASAHEVGAALRLLRWCFTFRSTPRGTTREAWSDAALENTLSVWNPEFPSPILLSSEGSGRFECRCLAVPTVPSRAHYRIAVERDLRAGDVMNAEHGLGRWDPDLADPARRHPAARLAGHALGLPDEHSVTSPFHGDDLPGDVALMAGGAGLRARYFWPLAEWVRARIATPLGVSFAEQGPHRLPGHPDPARTFGWWPAADAELRPGARLELTLLGRDDGAFAFDGGSAAGQGLLRVLLRLRCDGFPKHRLGSPALPAHERDRWAREALLGRLRGQVAADLDDRFTVRGELQVGGEAWTMSRCPLRFVLVVDDAEPGTALRFDPGEASALRSDGEGLTLVYRTLDDVGDAARELIPALCGIEGKTTTTLSAEDLLPLVQQVLPGAEVMAS